MSTAIRFSDISREVCYSEDFPGMTLEMGYNYKVKLDPTSIDVAVAPVTNGYRVTGSFPYRAVAACSRCLEDVVFQGVSSFDLLYKPGSQSPEEREVNISSADTCVVFYRDDVPLRNLLLQQIYLELPEKILCKEDCLGLCPDCGANLNEGSCGCSGATDPRWSGLQSLLPS